jgi:hypothetical protein
VCCNWQWDSASCCCWTWACQVFQFTAAFFFLTAIVVVVVVGVTAFF